MNVFLSFLIRIVVSALVAVLAWPISFFGFDQTFWISTGISLVGGGVTYFAVKGFTRHRFLKAQGLTRREYKYIKQNLNEAKEKIKRLNKALFSVKYLPQLRQNIEIVRITRKIYSITKKDPRRFYLGEKFFFYHIDSLVELAEKYSFLASQPTKNRELNLSLIDTRRTIDELTNTLEKDLDTILSKDIDKLNFELDVAKRTIKTNKDSQFHDESRRFR